MRRVFVTQQPRPNRSGWVPNLESASKFGAIHYVFSASDHPTHDTIDGVFLAAGTLNDFNPEQDYILWPNTGDPMANQIVNGLLFKRFDKLTFLNFERYYRNGQRDPRNGFYTAVDLRLPSEWSERY